MARLLATVKQLFIIHTVLTLKSAGIFFTNSPDKTAKLTISDTGIANHATTIPDWMAYDHWPMTKALEDIKNVDISGIANTGEDGNTNIWTTRFTTTMKKNRKQPGVEVLENGVTRTIVADTGWIYETEAELSLEKDTSTTQNPGKSDITTDIDDGRIDMRTITFATSIKASPDHGDRETNLENELKYSLGELSCMAYETCQERCGHLPISDGDSDMMFPCQCDYHCWLYGDCCQDFYTVCLHSDMTVSDNDLFNTTLSFVHTYSHLIHLHSNYHWSRVSSCKQVKTENSQKHIQMVTHCSGHSDILTRFTALHTQLAVLSIDRMSYFAGLSMEDITHRCSPDGHRDIPDHPLRQIHMSLTYDPFIHFYNVFCAVCNGVHPHDLTAWSSQIQCDSSNISLANITSFLSHNMSSSNYKFLHCSTTSSLTWPHHMGRPCFPFNNNGHASDSAGSNANTSEFSFEGRLCARYQYPFFDGLNSLYKNRHCQAFFQQPSDRESLITEASLRFDHAQHCPHPECYCLLAVTSDFMKHHGSLLPIFILRFILFGAMGRHPPTHGPLDDIPNFRLLFDFSSDTLTTLIINETKVHVENHTCPSGQIYVPALATCKQLICADDKRLVGRECVPTNECQLHPCANVSTPDDNRSALLYLRGSKIVTLNMVFAFVFDNTWTNDVRVVSGEDTHQIDNNYYTVDLAVATSHSGKDFVTTVSPSSENSPPQTSSRHDYSSDYAPSGDDKSQSSFSSLSDMTAIWLEHVRRQNSVNKSQWTRRLKEAIWKTVFTETPFNLPGKVRVTKRIFCTDAGWDSCKEENRSRWAMDQTVVNNVKVTETNDDANNDNYRKDFILKPKVTAHTGNLSNSVPTESNDVSKDKFSNPCDINFMKKTFQDHNLTLACASIVFELNETEDPDDSIASLESSVRSFMTVARDNNFILSRFSLTNKDITTVENEIKKEIDHRSVDSNLEWNKNSLSRNHLCPFGFTMQHQRSSVHRNDKGVYVSLFNDTEFPLQQFEFKLDFHLNRAILGGKVRQATLGWCVLDVNQLQCPSSQVIEIDSSNFVWYNNTVILTNMASNLTDFLSTQSVSQNSSLELHNIPDDFLKDFPEHSVTIFEAESFILTNGKAIVCNRFDESYQTENQTEVSTTFTFRSVPGSFMERVATLVASIVSIICLIATLIVYTSLPSLRNLPGKIVMSLSLALLLAQLLFLCCQYPRGIFCQIYAALTHAAWLASFLWLAIMSFDLAYTLHFQNTSHDSISRGKRFKVFSLLGWGIPCVIAIACFTLDRTELVSVSYGKAGTCWIGNLTSLIVVFGVPVFSALAISSICSIFAIKAIRSSAKFRNTSTFTHKKDRKHILLCINLAFLMGLGWIFYFIALVVGNSYLWMIHILVNGSQGLNIFLSYVARKSTLSKLKARWGQIMSSPGNNLMGSVQTATATTRLSSPNIAVAVSPARS